MWFLRIGYQIGISLYGLALRIAALWHDKARKWVKGRRDWEASLQAVCEQEGDWLWMHCASLGEFEQGRNLVEELRAQHPEWRILITFFSPSGYEIRKNYAHVDAVLYLPLDTPGNARRWVKQLKPKWVLWIRYEFWLNYLQELHLADIPTLLVSARLQDDSPFLKSPLAPLYRQAFESFSHIFTQDTTTTRLLRTFAPHARVSQSADTRYDRVFVNKSQFTPLPEIEAFVQQRLCIVAGSTWPEGEELLLPIFERLAETYDLCLIIAPHEIHSDRIDRACIQVEGRALRYSELDTLSPAHRMLWIDNIGMLSRLYAYADIAYVGGGWGTGLHNILEPAVFGPPILIGPDHRRFPEAAELIAAGGAFSISNEAQLGGQLEHLLSHAELRGDITSRNQTFVRERVGATAQILDWLHRELV